MIKVSLAVTPNYFHLQVLIIILLAAKRWQNKAKYLDHKVLNQSYKISLVIKMQCYFIVPTLSTQKNKQPRKLSHLLLQFLKNKNKLHLIDRIRVKILQMKSVIECVYYLLYRYVGRRISWNESNISKKIDFLIKDVDDWWKW